MTWAERIFSREVIRFKVLHGHISVSTKVQERVLEQAGVPVRENESIAFGKGWIMR